jgi:hypothetical protein
MPYIEGWIRENFDSDIDKISDQWHQTGFNPGVLNYIISRLIGTAFNEQPGYHRIAELSGAISDVQSEFYRRVVVPYEEAARLKNGDIVEYERGD